MVHVLDFPGGVRRAMGMGWGGAQRGIVGAQATELVRGEVIERCGCGQQPCGLPTVCLEALRHVPI